MEWKHGLRNEALVTTVQGYFGKLATSVTGWLSGMVLTWINYVPLTDSLGNAVPQTDPTMLNGIWAVFCILLLREDFTVFRLLFILSTVIFSNK